MPHSLILGITESGKTTLARSLSNEYRRMGSGVIVLDPLRDPRWQADHLVTDADEFLSLVWRSRSCMLFIDEAGDMIGRYDNAMQRIVTRGRHWGHSAHIITQRGAQLPPTVRNQCRYLFLFCTARADCEVLAREFNQDELLDGNKLAQGEYFFASRFGKVERRKITLGAQSHDETATDSRRADSRIRSDSGGKAAQKGNGNAASAADSASASGSAAGNPASRLDSPPE